MGIVKEGASPVEVFKGIFLAVFLFCADVLGIPGARRNPVEMLRGRDGLAPTAAEEPAPVVAPALAGRGSPGALNVALASLLPFLLAAGPLEEVFLAARLVSFLASVLIVR